MSSSRYYAAFGLLSHLLPPLHRCVHMVGLPSSHQPPGLQRPVCDGGLLHGRSHGVSLCVPVLPVAGRLPPRQPMGPVRVTHVYTEGQRSVHTCPVPIALTAMIISSAFGFTYFRHNSYCRIKITLHFLDDIVSYSNNTENC